MSADRAPRMPTPAFLALGDSYTIGEAVEPEERWPLLLAQRLREAGIGIGTPRIVATTGWTTDELSAALDALEADEGPLPQDHALVSLLIGVNNQYRRRGLDAYAEQFAALLTRAIGYAGGDAGRVLVLAIPDWGRTPFGGASGRDLAQVSAELDAFNATAARLSADAGARFVDTAPLSRRLSEDPAMHAEDGLHPSGAMYAAWADAALPAASAVLAHTATVQAHGASASLPHDSAETP